MGRWWEHGETAVPPEHGPYHTLETLREAEGTLEMYMMGFIVEETATHYKVACVISADGEFSTTFEIAKGAVDMKAIDTF